MISFRTIALTALAVSLCSHAGADTFRSYEDCRRCHSDIFKLWSSSIHATSYSNPTFQSSYMSVLLDSGKEAGRLCLRCHAPAAQVQNDMDLKSPVAAEGVTCWYCHSISSVNSGERIENYYNIDTSGVMYGPYEAEDISDHEVIHSPIHLQADVCAGCHEFVNDNGVGILETFSEWKDSPYGRDDVYCQNCHMPIEVDLSVVDSKKVSNYYVTAHEFQGGHSRVNLANAVDLETKIKKVGSRLEVSVLISNTESGHKLPTGIPIRRLVLKVALKSKLNIEISSARKVYRKVLTDRYGAIIERASDMFMNATEIYSDNRIKPQETRVENFVFVVPEEVDDYRIETVLNYEYTRPLLKEEHVTIRMAKNVIKSGDID